MLKSKLMKLLKYSVTPSQTLTFIWPTSMEKQKNTDKPKKIICVQSKSIQKILCTMLILVFCIIDGKNMTKPRSITRKL